jgi:catechol 2,3-dioxygenase-like lactoylglutathione lyase family enzyme
MAEANTVDPAVAFHVLPSLDLAVTKAFYVEVLGLRDVAYEGPDYLIVRRDRLELHFWLTDDGALPPVSSCYIRGGQIAALHEEFAERKVERLSPFEVRPWGMKEFYVHDPHGNLLRFGTDAGEV